MIEPRPPNFWQYEIRSSQSSLFVLMPFSPTQSAFFKIGIDQATAAAARIYAMDGTGSCSAAATIGNTGPKGNRRTSMPEAPWPAPGSSFVKGETLRDTARNICALNADMIVLRHSAPGSAKYLSEIVDVPVINAGDGSHEHPTQALLDGFTLLEHLGSLDGKKVTILGDILFSRVARSNIFSLTKLGAEVTVAGPATLVPKTFESMGVKVVHDLRTALDDADAVMLLRIQHERQSSSHFPSLGEYTSMFGLSKARAKWLKPETIIMHPGPINRGVEIDSDLADSDRSVILEQVSNGIATRMAVLYLCTGGSISALETSEE